MDGTHIAGNVTIGSHVYISTLIATTNDNQFGARGYDESFIKGPIIEDYVSVGSGVNILPGVRIEKGSIVGVGAVVTKNMPSNKLVLGVPARIVRDLKQDEIFNTSNR